MKIWSYLGKILKWILWFLLLGAFLFLIVGYAKFDGGIKDYIHYLNQKDRNDAVSHVKPLSLSSYGYLFWSESTGNLISGTGSVVGQEKIVVEELEINLDDGIDIFNPEYADDFESFFAEEKIDVEDDSDNFGFVNSSTGSDFTGELEDNNYNEDETENDGEVEELSDNKKSLLKIFGR